MISDTLQKIKLPDISDISNLAFFIPGIAALVIAAVVLSFTIRFYIKHNGAIQFTVFMVLIFVSLVLFIISIALLVAGGAIIGYEKAKPVLEQRIEVEKEKILEEIQRIINEKTKGTIVINPPTH
ncbi:hypothetical protein [Mesomycoplasma hyorhinis]|uniref:Uncharacterized protein n=4 Tax=Mesomycoplasma hyorhinis TaxID=2100 RepID=A0AAJ2YQL7_MESHY|nr:hypothetical protein [Mesomycoplasma hyorhinis]ADM21741.1 hypothetical protein MHR_0274 [Mesomycoplasma hyorhinis HUB-1]AEC45678.1 hypothetical protein SRH_00545 [Mesomycoplasma hyorhinis MCLD]AEX14084.1 hypothetical protein MYM_0309 [Mesomycoplasma hyorhinis GDL-1]AFX74233.1 hypothetical protein MOS_306 [Mesomycoplasma hyorhinis SK76]AHA41080.1 hypothetical protein Q453_0340 [Mesomycoplasma hyorhinis DBS 1050]TRM73850.1 hypothetical protein DJ532_14235 [Sulfolobus sp. A20-N-F8]TRM82516.1